MGPLPLLAGVFAAVSTPIWHPLNTSAHFVYFRSPPFVLPGLLSTLSSTPLEITATASPNVGAHGTTQSKLYGGFVVYVNGVITTSGPGHAIPDLSQPLRFLDLLPLHLLRDPPQINTLAVRCFFQNSWVGDTDPSAVPRLQAVLTAVPAVGGGGGLMNVTLATTGPTWKTLNADPYHSPAGDPPLKSGWYHVPNENLNTQERPLGWESPQFDDSQWGPAVAQPPFTLPIIPAAPSTSPAFLTRTACSVTRLASGATLIDYGQEFLGGVNLTFGDQASPTSFLVQLGEELTASGEVMVPCRSSVNYTAQWTLAAGGGGVPTTGLNAGLHAHEFIQFRYAQLSVGAPSLLAANAWVVTAPRGGDGVNPYEIPCAKSTPVTPGRETNPATSHHATFASSNSNLNAVWRLCAYSMVATALDINVDSQTRQRDLCHVDAYITNSGQHAVFPSRDTAVESRTVRAAFQVSSSILPSSFDFKASTVLMAGVAAREAGDVDLLRTVWGEDHPGGSGNASIFASEGNGYLSAQFLSGLWYMNASVGGLYIPSNCVSPFWGGCDPLIDWPTQTRDGYMVSEVDALRNSFGAAALRTLSHAATALGNATASHFYATHSHTIATTLATKFLRWNATSGEAYFVDGYSGPSSKHAAIHSTLYAVALGGALDAWAPPPNATTLTLASALTTHLIRRGGYGPASCMTAKAALQALYTLGVYDGRAADLALELLTKDSYPGWVDMINNGATVTLEAWAWGDKWNTDAGHPWCASPSFLIPGGLFGVRPGEGIGGVEGGGWKEWAITPQPGNLTSVNMTLPTWVGEIAGEFMQGGGGMGVTLRVTVPTGSSASVCLPPLHPTFRTEGGEALEAAADTLTVNGESVPSKVVGRLLCAVDPLIGQGMPFVVVRS